jgi:hypothetical protein
VISFTLSVRVCTECYKPAQESLDYILKSGAAPVRDAKDSTMVGAGRCEHILRVATAARTGSSASGRCASYHFFYFFSNTYTVLEYQCERANYLSVDLVRF